MSTSILTIRDRGGDALDLARTTEEGQAFLLTVAQGGDVAQVFLDESARERLADALGSGPGMRAQALQFALAADPSLSAEDIVTRAREYERFLRGDGR